MLHQAAEPAQRKTKKHSKMERKVQERKYKLSWLYSACYFSPSSATDKANLNLCQVLF